MTTSIPPFFFVAVGYGSMKFEGGIGKGLSRTTQAKKEHNIARVRTWMTT